MRFSEFVNEIAERLEFFVGMIQESVVVREVEERQRECVSLCFLERECVCL